MRKFFCYRRVTVVTVEIHGNNGKHKPCRVIAPKPTCSRQPMHKRQEHRLHTHSRTTDHAMDKPRPKVSVLTLLRVPPLNTAFCIERMITPAPLPPTWYNVVTGLRELESSNIVFRGGEGGASDHSYCKTLYFLGVPEKGFYIVMENQNNIRDSPAFVNYYLHVRR